MRHPSTRAERRHHRARVIAKRCFVLQRIPASSWAIQQRSNPLVPGYSSRPAEGGRYAKWNLNCGSPMCHAEKYFKPKRKRREALKTAGRDEIMAEPIA